MPKLFIVAGHGKKNFFQKDVGAIAKDMTTERDLNVAIARRIKAEKIGVEEDLTLTEKIKRINSLASSDDILISIHCNSAGPSAHGVEAWYYSGSAKSRRLAECLTSSLSKKVGLKNRGVKDERKNRHGRLAIVHDTRPLAILLEIGFLSNKKDLEILKNSQNEIASAIFDGVQKFLGKSKGGVFEKLSAIWFLGEKVSSIKGGRIFGKRISNLAHKCAEELRN